MKIKILNMYKVMLKMPNNSTIRRRQHDLILSLITLL